jgi:hypothetical protein
MFHSIKNFNAIHIDLFPETKVSIYFSFGMVEVSIRFDFSTATELMSGHQLWCNLYCFIICLPLPVMVMSQNLNFKFMKDWVTLLFFFLHQKFIPCDPRCYFGNAAASL